MIVKIHDYCGEFAENKDQARTIRDTIVRPAVETALRKKRPTRLVLDFTGVDSSTQSFVHALLSGIFQEHGEPALNAFEFKNCNKAVKSLITTVINYSLE